MENKGIYISKESFSNLANSMSSNPDGKNWIWTTDKDIELPILLGKSGLEALTPQLLTTQFIESAQKFGDRPLYQEFDKVGNRWVGLSYKEALEKVKELARSIIGLGIPPRSCITIIGNNSIKWMLSLWGAIFANCIPVGLYPTNTVSTCLQIIQDCKPALCFVEDKEQLEKFKLVRKDSGLPIKLVTFVKLDTREEENIFHFDALPRFATQVSEEKVEALRALARPGITAVILYTSGTTGVGKGVLLSHDNLSYLNVVFEAMNPDIPADSRILSYLPLSHIAALFFEGIQPSYNGSTVYFADKEALKSSLPFYLERVRPTNFLAVPRIWEKIEDKIRAQVENSNPIRRALFSWALKVGQREWRDKLAGKPVSMGYKIADRVIFSALKRRLGLDECKLFFFGAAPMKSETREFFCSIGITLNNAYGLTETTGGIALTPIQELPRLKLESCGRALPGCRGNVEQNEELSFGGRTIFNGYLNREKETKEVINMRKEFLTGDMGRIDSEGNIFITGRLKELIVTAGGENVAPLPIENGLMLALPGIFSAIIAIGDQKPFISALFFLKNKMDALSLPEDELDPDASLLLAKRGVIARTISEVLAPENSEPLKKMIEVALAEVNKNAVSNASVVKRWAVMPRDISVPTGELTHTVKLKRKAIEKNFAEQIAKIYNEPKL